MNNAQEYKQYADTELIQKILGGEVYLFEIIIRRYNSYLFKIGRTYGFEHEDSEDLMQETYISAYKHLSQFEGKSSFKTWLVKIMLSHCYHQSNKSSFKNEVSMQKDPDEKLVPMFSNQVPTIQKSLINKELGAVIENALLELPMDYRIVFSLRELNNLSTIETAEALGISQSNVKIRLNRSKALLRNEIKKMYSSAEIFEFNLIYCDRIVENVMAHIHHETE